MDRFFVPGLLFLVVGGLATLLIGVIVLRSPYTHSNLGDLRPEYARTSLALVGQVGETMTLGQKPTKAGNPEPLDPGRAIYLTAGCTICHGLDARGGVTGPSLAGSLAEIVKHMVRDGPGGMPAWPLDKLSDADLGTLATYLQGLEVARPSTEEIATIQRITYNPLVPMDVLLKGKVAIRRSCGACHAQPGTEDILRAFDSDAKAAGLVAEMVQETNLSLEDARAIAYYMLAVLNGADPVKER